MQLIARADGQGDLQPQEDGLCWTWQLSLDCPQPATLRCRLCTLQAKRIPRGSFNPLESQADKAVTVASARASCNAIPLQR